MYGVINLVCRRDFLDCLKMRGGGGGSAKKGGVFFKRSWRKRAVGVFEGGIDNPVRTMLSFIIKD